MSKLRLSVGVLAFTGLILLIFTQSESYFVGKALASGSYANNEGLWESPLDSYDLSIISGRGADSSNSSGGTVIDHGNVANPHCPIWEITVVITGGGVSSSCKTPGTYKCFDGTCPHGI